MLDSRLKGRRFEPHGRHCVMSLSKNINPSLVLVQPRKTHPFITERLLMGGKELYQTNKQNHIGKGLHYSQTPDRDFLRFYPCEIILFYLKYLYQPVGKIRNEKPHAGRTSFHHCDVKMTSPCHISAYSGFSGSIFHVFPK